MVAVEKFREKSGGDEEERLKKKEDKAEVELKKVRVISAGNLPFDIYVVPGKKKASQVRKELKTLLNIADEARAWVNGQEVSDDYVLQGGEQLEFIRQAGAKG